MEKIIKVIRLLSNEDNWEIVFPFSGNSGDRWNYLTRKAFQNKEG
jgi:hypothetical protein